MRQFKKYSQLTSSKQTIAPSTYIKISSRSLKTAYFTPYPSPKCSFVPFPCLTLIGSNPKSGFDKFRDIIKESKVKQETENIKTPPEPQAKVKITRKSDSVARKELKA